MKVYGEEMEEKEFWWRYLKVDEAEYKNVKVDKGKLRNMEVNEVDWR